MLDLYPVALLQVREGDGAHHDYGIDGNGFPTGSSLNYAIRVTLWRAKQSSKLSAAASGLSPSWSGGLW